jgi:NAD(P)-dependent dehydrogenase (short-subunit alcohol dehydrogenase family)
MINDAGGTAIAIRVDHTVESEVKALFKRIDRKHKRLDILVDSVAGEDPMMGQWGNFWQADLKNADAIFRQALTSHIITAKHAAPIKHAARVTLVCQSSCVLFSASPSAAGRACFSVGLESCKRCCRARSRARISVWSAERASHSKYCVWPAPNVSL